MVKGRAGPPKVPEGKEFYVYPTNNEEPLKGSEQSVCVSVCCTRMCD